MTAKLPQGPTAGFTLIELMIVVVIASILLAIAIPTYRHEIQESRRTDAKTALLDLAAREQRYFSVQNSFTTSFVNLGYASSGTPASVTVGSGYYSISVSVPAAAPDPQAGNIAASFVLLHRDPCGRYLSSQRHAVRHVRGGFHRLPSGAGQLQRRQYRRVLGPVITRA